MITDWWEDNQKIEDNQDNEYIKIILKTNLLKGEERQ